MSETGSENKDSKVTDAVTTPEKPKKGKKKHVAAFVISGLLAVILLVYGGIAIYFTSHFLPHTYINGIDCSQKKITEVAELLEQQAQGYVLDITGRVDEDGTKDEIGELTATDMQLQLVDTLTAVQEMLDNQNPVLWIGFLWQGDRSEQLLQGVTFDEDLLKSAVKAMDAFQNSHMIAPKDAYIGEYSQQQKGYEIVADTMGTKLDMDSVLEVLETAIYGHADSVDLDEQGCYASADITADDKTLRDCLDTINSWVSSEITYDWNGSEVVLDGDTIQEWITFEKNEPVLDEDAVKEFVSSCAKEYDTYGKKRKFTTTLGVELTLPSGAFGWKTDREQETEELTQLIYQGSKTDKEPVYSCQGAVKGSSDIGSSYVEIDLTNQHLYLYQKGTIVLETDFVSGNMSKKGCMTPPGVFGLTYKTKNAVLRGADYETPVNYWMPFNGNVGMHDATWRATFGGDIYLTRGSHGCVNLPLGMAAQIYEYVSTGFPVICYYY